MTGHLIATAVTKNYAGLVAADAVDLEVRPGEIIGLIGPNGAGKTTTFNCLTGAQKLTSGKITLNGKDISTLPASDRARLGIARTFQHAQLFKHLSVEENLLLGRHRSYGAGAIRGGLGLAGDRERAARRHAHQIAGICGLTPVLDAPVGDLPYGTQRMVEVARAIILDPEVLLVDEPGAGMDSGESVYFGQLLGRIARERGMSVLIIEHDVAMVLALCDRIYVLNFGQLLAQGTPAEIRANAEVRAAYLGSTGGGGVTSVAEPRQSPPLPQRNKPLLAARGLEVAYGSVTAVRHISLQVGAGEIVALLGPNGAGKTSTLRGLTGLVRPTSGRVTVAGVRVDNRGPAAAVRAGMAHVPEGRRVFPEMTVLDNLRLGAWNARRKAKVVDERVAQAFDLFPRLSERRTQAAGSLSGGEQQMLAIARALMSDPKILLIDELSLGLSPLAVDEILARLVELNREGLSILLIEQFVHRALEVADRLYVLNKGRISFSGTPAAAVHVGAVEEAYL